jgi:hypothetical protein
MLKLCAGTVIENFYQFYLRGRFSGALRGATTIIGSVALPPGGRARNPL